MKKTFISLLAFASLFGAVSTAEAQQCSSATISGTYGFHGLAMIVQTSGPATPRAIIGTFTFDGRHGTWSASLTLDDNGVITHPPAAGSVGTYTVNEDCTGTLLPSSGGNVAIVIVDGGREIYQMRIDPANVVLFGTTERISSGAASPFSR